MRLEFLRTLCIVSLLVISIHPSVHSQSYQTQFGEVKFDRAKGPGTFHGGVEVEGASGHLIINIPLGPGIGARGLKFQPILQGQWSPQIEVYPMYTGSFDASGMPTQAWDPTSWAELQRAAASGGFNLTPGFFQLTFDETPEDSIFENFLPTKIPGKRLTNFQGPEGWNASVSMDTPLAGQVPTLVEANALAATFGFVDTGWTIGRMLDQVVAPSTEPFIRRGPTGELVLGLEHPTLAPRRSAVPIIGTALHPGASSPDTYYWFPSDFLVIRGDLAYEFEWRSNRYSAIEKTYFGRGAVSLGNGNPQNLENWTGHRLLKHSAFALKSIRNRFGDRIDFTSSTTGTWTATWVTSNGNTSTSITWDGVTLSYQGEGPQPSFKVEGISPNQPYRADTEGTPYGPASIKTPYDGFKTSKITKLTFLSTGETVDFDFGSTAVAWNSAGWPIDFIDAPSKVTFPGRTVTVYWGEQTEFFRNMAHEIGLVSDHYLAMGANKVAGYLWLPVYRWGVNQIIDEDTVSGGLTGTPSSPTYRITTHTRHVPIPTRKSDATWTSTAFYDLVTHPDGRSTLTTYVEPPQNIVGVAPPTSTSRDVLMQTLAYSKHQPVEVRHYAKDVDPTLDITVTNPSPGQPYLVPLSASVAYRAEVHDRWDIRGVSNPDGNFDLSAVPFATRVRTWDKMNHVLETKEHTSWDSSSRGWKTLHTIREDAATAPTLTVDILSRVQNSQDVDILTVTPIAGTYRVENRTFDSNVSQWIFSRPTFEQLAVQVDASFAAAPGQVLPFNLPATAKIYDPNFPQLNRIASIQVGNVTTQFQFKGTSGMAGNQVDTAKLIGPWLLSSQVGATYGYDPVYGLLNSISPMGVLWNLGQSVDGLGRVTSQDDANKVTTTYQWDAASRLSLIQPADVEKGTIITPDADNRGYTVDHGWERTQYRYNPYGELILERRFNGGNCSYRLFGYDAGGRKIAETVWLDGLGNETEWKAPNLVQAAQLLTSYTPGHYEPVCAVYDQVTGVCTKFTKEWVPANSLYQGAGGLHEGTSFSFDGFGRPSTTTDPNGQQSLTTYGVRTKTVTQGYGTPDAVSTTFDYDVDGRLWKVTDAKSQVTEYRYDPAGRIATVTQWAGPGGAGASQSRAWTYNDQGWLTELNQPESGRTVYSNFTVLGKPTVTTYYGDGSKPAFSVTLTPDTLGRTRAISSSDNTMSETIGYDESGHGKGNNKLTSASVTESGLSRSLTYGGLNGRLSSLTYTLDGLPPFTQSLAWNNDGTLYSRTYPDGKTQVLLYDSYKALPNGSLFPGGGTTTLAYHPIHWGLAGITFPGATTTFLTYDRDQTRLRYMGHFLGTTPKQEWNYSFDGVGRLATDGEDQYGYDALGRLTSVLARDAGAPTGSFLGSSNALNQVIDYDAFGNRTSLSTMTVTNWAWSTAPPANLSTTPVSSGRDLRSYSMDSANMAFMAATNHLPEKVGAVPTGATYDGFGNLSGILRTPGDWGTQITMTYDALGRVRSMTDLSGGAAMNYLYAYDDQGLRIRTEVWKGGVLQKKVYSIYNEARQLVAQYELVVE